MKYLKSLELCESCHGSKLRQERYCIPCHRMAYCKLCNGLLYKKKDFCGKCRRK